MLFFASFAEQGAQPFHLRPVSLDCERTSNVRAVGQADRAQGPVAEPEYVVPTARVPSGRELVAWRQRM
jgi:hypothetical protein